MKKLLLSAAALSVALISVAQTLNPTGDLGVARWKHQAQLLNNGKVLAFGGDDGALGDSHNSSELYNPVSGTWSDANNMNDRRRNFASAILPDGNILAIGGNNTASYGLATCEIYDVDAGTWSYTGEMTTPRWGHNAVTLLDGRILVSGGGDDEGTAEIYDPATNEWTLTGSLPGYSEHGQYSSLVLLADGRALSTGGWFADPDGKLANIYDPVADTWSSAPDMLADRQGVWSVLLDNGKVLVYGSTVSTSADLYDPVANTFTATGETQALKAHTRGVKLNDGRVFVYGNVDFGSPFDNKAIEIYDPVSGTWSSPVMSQPGASSYALVVLETGQILIMGGLTTTRCWLVGGVAVGLQDNELTRTLEMNLYPNPTDNMLNIQLNSDNTNEQVAIDIIDISGRTVLSTSQVSGMTEAIDISFLSSGIYTCRVTGDKQNMIVKSFMVK